jgi:hypothetical protein
VVDQSVRATAGVAGSDAFPKSGKTPGIFRTFAGFF